MHGDSQILSYGSGVVGWLAQALPLSTRAAQWVYPE